MPVVANTSSGNSSSQDSYDYTTNYDSSEYCTATDVSSDDEASYNDKAGIYGLLKTKLRQLFLEPSNFRWQGRLEIFGYGKSNDTKILNGFHVEFMRRIHEFTTAE